jgi:NitT/TauT family transport system substrate-binding protein
MNRRLLRACLFACAALLPVLTLTSVGTAQTPVTIRVATTPVDIGAQPFYAEDLGLFKKAGLDVTVSVIANGAAVSAAVLGGTFDIAQSNVPTLATAHEKGLPFVIVAPAGLYSSKAPTSVCGVAKNSPIKSAKDLAGKTIGVTGLLNITQVAANAWLEKNGVDTSTVKYVEVPFSGIAPALEAGRLDMGVLVDPFLQEALNAGQTRVLADCYDAVAPTFLVGAFFSTSDYAKAHPDVVKKFVAVMAEAARWANAHQRESAQILEKWTKSTPVPGMARVVYADRLSVAQVQPIIDASARAHALKATFPATELFAPGVGGP